jgi:hypothetical protein
MDTALKRLANRLERVGLVTAPFRDHVEVRLPLFGHVRVRVLNGRLQCEPYTGSAPRTRATVLFFALFGAILVTAFARHGITPDTIGTGFLSVLAFALETIRYVLTESAITRIQAVVLAEPGLLDEEAAALSPGGRPALGTGSGAAAEVRQPAGERVR